jgi:YVTN family beta-propeller protein
MIMRRFSMNRLIHQVMLPAKSSTVSRPAVINVQFEVSQMKRLLALPILLLLAANCQDAGRITQPDLRRPNFAVTSASTGPFAYVTNAAAPRQNTVSVIETATNTTVVPTIPVGLQPLRVAITPDGAFVYVTNRSGGSVSVIATATNTVVTTVPVGSGPNGVAITPNGAFAYVANQGGTVSVIATASNTVVATVNLGAVQPLRVAITPDGAFAYVTLDFPNTVSVIETATNTEMTTVPVGSRPFGVAITPDGAFAYVANFQSGTVSVIATATNTVVATVSVGANPDDVAITPDGAFAYVTNLVSGTVSVIATASNTVVATIGGFSRPVGIAITPLPAVIAVAIDIKPRSDPNSINCSNENEVVTVAILTTGDFDATTVDHTTVTFEGASETHVNKNTGASRRHEEDVDGDGDTDLVFHFRLGDTDLDCGSTEGTLTGETFDGIPIEGTDAVNMIDRGQP